MVAGGYRRHGRTAAIRSCQRGRNMDPRSFDAFARSLAGPKSRRGLLGGLVAFAAGVGPPRRSPIARRGRPATARASVAARRGPTPVPAGASISGAIRTTAAPVAGPVAKAGSASKASVAVAPASKPATAGAPISHPIRTTAANAATSASPPTTAHRPVAPTVSAISCPPAPREPTVGSAGRSICAARPPEPALCPAPAPRTMPHVRLAPA